MEQLLPNHKDKTKYVVLTLKYRLKLKKSTSGYQI